MGTCHSVFVVNEPTAFTKNYQDLLLKLSAVPLHDKISNMLLMLLAIDSVDTQEADGLYNSDILTEALRRYETIWLPLLARAHTERKNTHLLLPPIDVLFVSYLHRLTPEAYHRDCLALFGYHIPFSNFKTDVDSGLCFPALPNWTLKMPSSSHKRQVRYSQKLWDAQVACNTAAAGAGTQGLTSAAACPGSPAAAATSKDIDRQQSPGATKCWTKAAGVGFVAVSKHAATVAAWQAAASADKVAVLQSLVDKEPYQPLYFKEFSRRLSAHVGGFTSRLSVNIIASGARQQDFT
eukprot:GHRR01018630.1.p1 GENE.GHRR01018630.1~~GHRR01018630.1.p1  ORF type:complete len:294 (+),score=98.96 GHRR01018630.1:560-1441(+)